MTHKTAIHDNSGNVFADLGVENPEEYLAKSELAACIAKIIQNRRLTQAAAGRILGITQPKVSALLRGSLDGFSTDRLFRFLNHLGCDIQINVLPPRPRVLGRMKVMA